MIDRILQERETPQPIRQTTWKAGPEGTPDNARYRITLNGEPVPTAFFADTIGDSRGPYVRVYLAIGGGERLELQTLRGDVRIIPGDR